MKKDQKLIDHFRENVIPEAREQALEQGIEVLTQTIIMHFLNNGAEEPELAVSALVDSAEAPDWMDEQEAKDELAVFTGAAVGDMLANIGQFADDYLKNGENAIFLVRSVVVGIRAAAWLALGKDRGDIPETVTKYITEPVNALIDKLEVTLKEWVGAMRGKYEEDEKRLIADLEDENSTAYAMMQFQAALESVRAEAGASLYN